VVHRVKHRRTEARRAVKTIPGSKVAQAREEISILGMMSHPSILKLHETFEEPEHIHLVTELCPGRDLHRQIEATRRFSEELTAALTRQLLDAVGYMHGLGVSHRDLKPENLMLMSKKDPKFNPQGALLKVVDFGLARTFRKGDTFRDPAGRGYFLAPEALSGRYDYRCDLWSCGVVLYYMLSGFHPWNGETEQGVRHEIESGHIDFESDTFWDEVPEAPKQLIGMLARVSAADRASPEQALAHDFVRRDPAPPQLDDCFLGLLSLINSKVMTYPQVQWQIKHGRVYMLASVGIVAQNFFHMPDWVKTLDVVYTDRTSTLGMIQIWLFTAVMEGKYYSGDARIGQMDREPGDLGFDPLKLSKPPGFNLKEFQLKELKNGRQQW